jgi:uncharacterized membrane protein (UPF0127 family)
MKTLRPIVLLTLLLLPACRKAPAVPQSGLATVQMKLGSKTYTLEVANTGESRMRGLMRRDSMPADHGMIFVFAQPDRLGFYMRNTRIALDIIYIDENGKIDSIKPMQPYDETSVSSDGPCKWAVELKQGQGAAAGIKPGDMVEIPQAAQKPVN